MDNQQPKQKRGFALLSPERRKEISTLGGQVAHKLGVANKLTSKTAAIAGKKGGLSVSKNREHMAFIGQLGGLKSRKGKKGLA